MKVHLFIIINIFLLSRDTLNWSKVIVEIHNVTKDFLQMLQKNYWRQTF